jgi:hypothetical protein
MPRLGRLVRSLIATSSGQAYLTTPPDRCALTACHAARIRASDARTISARPIGIRS